VVSTLTPAKGQTISNAAITEVGPDNKINAYNYAGSTHLLMDVAGSFDVWPGTLGTGVASTRSGPASLPLSTATPDQTSFHR
jgi:hypothetical protein